MVGADKLEGIAPTTAVHGKEVKVRNSDQVIAGRIGEGVELENLKNNVKERNLEKNVELAGRINDDELKLRYSSLSLIRSRASVSGPNPPLHRHSPVLRHKSGPSGNTADLTVV